MSDNVVPLRGEAAEPANIWTCSCGSQQHYLYSDGSVECYVCGQKMQTGTWSKEKAAELIDKQFEARLTETVSHQTTSLAKASVLKKAKDREDVAMIFISYSDGGSSVWADVDVNPTQEQKDWFRRRAADCLSLALNEPMPGTVDYEEKPE